MVMPWWYQSKMGTSKISVNNYITGTWCIAMSLSMEETMNQTYDYVQSKTYLKVLSLLFLFLILGCSQKQDGNMPESRQSVMNKEIRTSKKNITKNGFIQNSQSKTSEVQYLQSSAKQFTPSEDILKRDGEEVSVTISKALKEPNDHIRYESLYNALQAGITLPSERLIDMIQHDPSSEIRLTALGIIVNNTNIERQKIYTIVALAVEDPDESVKTFAKQSLESILNPDQFASENLFSAENSNQTGQEKGE
jgi:hypothetical protein